VAILAQGGLGSGTASARSLHALPNR